MVYGVPTVKPKLPIIRILQNASSGLSRRKVFEGYHLRSDWAMASDGAVDIIYMGTHSIFLWHFEILFIGYKTF